MAFPRFRRPEFVTRQDVHDDSEYRDERDPHRVYDDPLVRHRAVPLGAVEKDIRAHLDHTHTQQLNKNSTNSYNANIYIIILKNKCKTKMQ